MIYFIQNETTKAVKIGKSNDPQKRIAGFQTAIADRLKLIGTLPGDRPLERKLHIRFSGFHIRGEWFRGDDILLNSIREILAAFNGNRNVWHEVLHRGYQVSHLAGRNVTVIGEHFITKIRGWKYSIDHDPILLELEGGRDVPADEVVFREYWPREFEVVIEDGNPLMIAVRI